MKTFFARVGVLVSLLVSAGLVLEAGARGFLAKRDPAGWDVPDYYVRTPVPYAMFGPKPGQYVGKNPSAEKLKGEYRIFVLGGSTVAVGRPPIPDLLEKKLRGDGFVGASVYNYGAISQKSGQELVRLLMEVVDYKPDLVVFYDGGNDVMDSLFWDPRPGYPYNFLAYEKNPLLDSNVRSYPTAAMCGLGSKLVRTAFAQYYRDRFFNLRRLRSEAGYLSPGWQERIAGSYVENLLKAQRVAEAFKSRFVAFFQPMVFYKKLRSPQEEALPGLTGRDTDESAYDHARKLRQIIRSQFEAAKVRHGLKVFDLSDAYDRSPETVFVDYIHTTQPAKAVVVDRIHAVLKELDFLVPRR